MSTLENGHFGQEPEVDVTDDILPSVLRNLKPSPQITSAHQKLDENAEKWLKTLPWSYADAVRKPAPKKDEPAAPQVPKEVEEPAEVPGPEVADVLEEPPQHKGEESGDVAGEADSGEDSDEEWNYISGKENHRQNNQQQKEELSAEDMESQLNPNAAEFVPVYSTTVEPDIASSPQKGMERSLENISIPSPNEFFKEICRRPSDIGVEFETSMNGDALNNLSTKAVFGDDSVCLNSTVDSLSNNEPLKETNPFAPSQVPNFVQDHFSIPDVCALDDSSHSDIDFKPFSSESQQEESEICFMASPDKQPDLISPSAPHNELEIKGSESSANDVSEITFGDGLNVEEIIRSKQDSPLLRESPEPGLGSGVDNNVDATPEEQANEVNEFCTIQKTTQVENSFLNHAATDGIPSHQGPETSVDSDSDQDDVLVCPIKKDHNIVANNENKNEETLVGDLNHEKYGNDVVELEHELVYHKDEEDFYIKDEKEVCCFRPPVKDSFVSDQPEIILEKNNIDKLDLAKDTFEKLETEFISKTDEVGEDENSAVEVIDDNAVRESSDFSPSDHKLHNDDFQTSKLVESEVTEVLAHEVEQSVDHSNSDIPEQMKEFSYIVSESEMEKSVTGSLEPVVDSFHDEQFENELQSHLEESINDIPKPTSFELTSSPIDHILESSSNQGEESVTSTEISHVDLMDHDEWSRKVIELNQEMRELAMETDKEKSIFSEETQIDTFKNSPHHEIDSENDEVDDKLCVKNDIYGDKTSDISTFDDLEKKPFVVNSVPSEVTSYYHGEDPFSIKSVGIKPNQELCSEEKNVPISLEDVNSSILEKPIGESITPVEEEVCKKQEVHEELICPIKLSPLTKETKEDDSKFLPEQEVIESISKFEDESTLHLEDEIEKLISTPEKDHETGIQEDLVCPMKQEVDLVCPMKQEVDLVCSMKQEVDPVCPMKQEADLVCPMKQEVDLVCPMKQEVDLVCPMKQEVDLVCSMKQEVDLVSPNEIKEQMVESEKVDHFMDFSSLSQKNINSGMYNTNETNYAHINLDMKQLDKEQFSMDKELDYHKSNVEEQMDELCPLRKKFEEEPVIESKSDDFEQSSPQDEIPYTDEMSSSMIDHGEDKNLPEAQSNQLDLVQELQFEVQEKQTEGDTESDSGFEIINASEASTVEMEMMRYQSEKEAGAVNEKLLLDRNEAESFEKSEEYVSNEVESNLISNEILSEKPKEEESVIPQKEEVELESSPKHVPEPLERTAELDLLPAEKAELVNGTATPPATPPATPAPGLQEEVKEGLIAAAVAAAGAATAVAAVATAVSESKVEEKKSPIKKTDAPTPKAGTATKAPLKGTTTKATSEKAPISKPSTPISKLSTPSSKPLAKPSSPSAKTASASKTSSLASAKPSTPTSKVGAKPAGSKPSTPTGTKAAPTAAKPKPAATSTAKPPLSKPATSAPAAKKPAALSTTAAKTTTTSSTLKPTAAAKPAAAAKPLASKPAGAKPAATTAPAKPPAAKPPVSKPGLTKTTPSSTLKPSSPSQRPSSAKGPGAAAAPPKTTAAAAKPLTKPAPAKTTTAAKPPASTTGAKPAAKPPVKAAPPAPINKKPAAPTAIKKPAPTDKSTKEANNKLTAKTALNKKIVDKKVISKKEVIDNEELPSQVAIVTTTNGHISLIENGMPPVEIAEEAN